MDTHVLLAPDSGPPLGRSRSRVLDLLRAADSPQGVQDVADRTGLHANTARFHLDGLVAAGLATRQTQARATPGRPSMTYRAAAGGPGNAAAEAGRQWGAYLTEQPPPYSRPSAGQAIGRLAAILAEIGFAPEAVTKGRKCQIRLRECPFREVAEHRQDVVCALHLGLMQGALSQMRAPVTAHRLEPFAEPSLCVAHLTVLEQPGSRQ